MPLFGPRRPPPPPAPRAAPAPGPLPVGPVDATKRYDVYCSLAGEDRLYEDIRFVGIRTFDRVSEFSSGLLGGYFEIEAADGTRALIPNFGIQIICEHGVRPAYQVVRRYGPW